MTPMRILYQSFTDPAVHMPYLSRLSEYLRSVASPGVEFVVRGMHPADTQLGRLSELRCGVQSVAGIIEAENEGFDAVLVGHFQDSLIFEARTAVDIPVIGYGEASLHQACMLGSRIGLVGIDPVYVPWHREQIRRYGLEDTVVDVCALSMSPADAVAAFDDPPAYEQIKGSFLGLAEKMVARSGVDVVMSAGGLFALLAARESALEVEGALIPNPTLLAVKQAELAVSVARITGNAVSRGPAFAKASKQSIYEFMELAAPTHS